MLKEKLAVNPGEPLEDVSFDKIIGYYKKLIGNYTPDVFLFDGLPPNVDFKLLNTWVSEVGEPKFILSVNVNK